MRSHRLKDATSVLSSYPASINLTSRVTTYVTAWMVFQTIGRKSVITKDQSSRHVNVSIFEKRKDDELLIMSENTTIVK